MFLHRERGFTLIELSLSMLVLGILSLITIPLIQDSFEDKKLQNDSERVEVIGKAAADYIRDNYSTIMAKLTVANAPESIIITVRMLKNSGALQVNTATTNGYDQSICILVKKHTVPTAANTTVVGRELLQGLLITEGGEAINDIDLAYYAGNIGATAGVITAANSLEIKGVGGSWIMPTAAFDNLVNDRGKHCNGLAGNVRLTPGHAVIGLWFPSDQTAGMLSRNTVGGSSEVNRMNTDIDMNGNDLLNVKDIAVSGWILGVTTGVTIGTADVPGELDVLDANGQGTITAQQVNIGRAAWIKVAEIGTARIDNLIGNLQIKRMGIAGNDCGSYVGAIGTTREGQLLSCTSDGKWVGPRGGGSSLSQVSSCSVGGDEWVLLATTDITIKQQCIRDTDHIRLKVSAFGGLTQFNYYPANTDDVRADISSRGTILIDTPVCWDYKCSAYFSVTKLNNTAATVPRTLVYFHLAHDIAN